MTFPVLSAGTSAYNLQRSLRFRSSATAYLNRTPASAGNRQIYTWSAWVKRGLLSSSDTYSLFDVELDANNWFTLWFRFDSLGYDVSYTSTANRAILKSTAVFRDPSSWYHVVLSVNTTNATAANRITLYVNNAAIALNFELGSSYVAQNTNTAVNATTAHNIARRNPGTPDFYFDGYMAEVNFIDGQALTPSSFGSTNAVTGVWQPAKYTGTYGTNGFYLPFTNTTSTTTLGNDFSGNGNNWTTNNISLTSGVTYDSMTDVPTLTSPTAANFCVLNPLVPPELSTTFNDGNLRFVGAGAVVGSMGMGAKTYVEMIPASAISVSIGVGPMVSGSRGGLGQGVQDSIVWFPTGSVFKDGGAVAVATYATFTSGDVCAFTFDPSNRQVSFYKNNTLQGSQTVSGTQAITFYGLGNTSASANVNFGQRPFAYTPPSGFVALNTFNLPSSTIPAGNKYMDATLYTGTGSSLSVTNSGSMQPDWVWIKSRSAATDHALYDVLRGTQSRLESNTTDAQVTSDNGVTAFGTSGFTVNTLAQVNTSAATYVGWQWKANGAGVTNTAGSITSTVSANTTSGFSVVTYTGTAIAGTIGHGLGVAPQLIIVKPRTGTITTDAWNVYHVSTGNTNFLILNATDASTAASNRWNNTSPTSSVFSIGTVPSSVSVGYVAYCFAPIAGFSAFGSYTGNGSTDGPFVYTGFRPRWILIKRSDFTANWRILDTSRDTSNVEQKELYPSLANAEGTFAALDGVSNGFKIRTDDSSYNASSGTYIYAAFAENPFRNALAR